MAEPRHAHVLIDSALQVLHDWQRGKIPFFAMPPEHSDRPAAGEGAAAAQAIANSAPTDEKVLP